MELKKEESGGSGYNQNVSTDTDVKSGELYIKTLRSEEDTESTVEGEEMYAYGVFLKSTEDVELGYFWDPGLAQIFLDAINANPTVLKKIKQMS